MAGVMLDLDAARRTREAVLYYERHRLDRPYRSPSPPAISSAPVDVVRVTSGTPTSGRYPAILREYDADAGTWADVADAVVWAIDPAGTTLANNTSYLARRWGEYDDKPVYSVAGAVGAATLDAHGYDAGVLTHYTGVDEITFVGDIGPFKLDGSGGTQLVLDIHDASPSYRGVVSASAQTFAGLKTFVGYTLSERYYLGTEEARSEVRAASSGDNAIVLVEAQQYSAAGDQRTVIQLESGDSGADGQVVIYSDDGSGSPAFLDWTLRLHSPSDLFTGMTGTFAGLQFYNGWLVDGEFSGGFTGTIGG